MTVNKYILNNSFNVHFPYHFDLEIHIYVKKASVNSFIYLFEMINF